MSCTNCNCSCSDDFCTSEISCIDANFQALSYDPNDGLNGALEALEDLTLNTITPPIGSIFIWGGSYNSLTTPPNGYLLCNGAYVSKTTYANLYAVIGDSYLNSGSAPTGTFRLPASGNSVSNGIIKY